MNTTPAVDFSQAKHTFVLSDLHLTTAEPENPKNPYWKRFQQREFFIDKDLQEFLQKIQEQSPEAPIELVLAGDIFDFDTVTQLPATHRVRLNWLEKKRGLNTEERKSRFKIRAIINDHPVFFLILQQFIRAGNRVVFIIGNHDLELHWRSVQELIIKNLRLLPEEEERVRFTPWFYISNKDTLIEHGNQYDTHSNCQNPINPKIRGRLGERIRLPFGCFAARYLTNGMGFFNPHSERTYLMSFKHYMLFLIGYPLRRQPLILWTWFWGALMTLWFTLRDGLKPEIKDPLTIEDQVEEIARVSNASPRMVRALRETHAPPSFLDPMGIMRELWLDRAFVMLVGFLIMFEILAFWKIIDWWIFTPTVWWGIILGTAMIWILFQYSRSIRTELIVDARFYEKPVRLGAQITGVNRVIYGHTHKFAHTNFSGAEYLNAGTWAPAFDDIACTWPSYPKSFIWIRPTPEAQAHEAQRIATLYCWMDKKFTLLC